MMKHVFIVCCLIVTFSACKKEDETITFTGKVTSSNINMQVEDAVVILDYKPVSSSLYTAGYKKLASGRSAADGSFEMEFARSRSSDYRVRVRKQGYFTFEKEYVPVVFESENTVINNYDIVPKAYVKVQLKNTTQYNSNDHLVFSFPDMENLGAGCCTQDYIHGHGRFFDTSFVCASAGDDYLIYEFNYTMGNSTSHSGPDSVFLNAFDTTALNVLY